MNKEEFTQRVVEAENTLYHVAKTILWQDSDCEDAVQEAILKAYTNLSKLRNEDFFKTWLVRILINECYKIRLKSKAQVPYEEYMEKEEAPNQLQDSGIRSAVLSLPEKQRMPVVLFYVEGYSVTEIARILHVPEGTVKSRLSAARKQLKDFLESKEGFVYG